MRKYVSRGLCLLLLLSGLSACFERDGLAPVFESNWRNANRSAQRHVVVRGETLYAIAFRYDQDYRQLAMTNRLRPPFTVRIGQVLRVQPSIKSKQPMPRPRMIQRNYRAPAITSRVYPQYARWIWPVNGHVVVNFVPQQGKKGIDIAGRKGEKIYAASSGTVAYAGSGLAGYGNLIIIKHDNQYLTAYGNNSRNLVTEGQSIKAGQVIADMGIVDRRFWGVHFEIRQAGKPVNPLNYLQRR